MPQVSVFSLDDTALALYRLPAGGATLAGKAAVANTAALGRKAEKERRPS